MRYLILSSLALSMSMAAFAQQPESPADSSEVLNLICSGAGAANKADVATVNGSSSATAYGSNGNWATANGTSNATIVARRSQSFTDQVSLTMTPKDGRLRMPPAMLPLFRGGDDGWFKLKNIEYKSNEITATIAVNFMNKPKLSLDRYTGAISISGKAGDYSGRCTKYDPTEIDRQF